MARQTAYIQQEQQLIAVVVGMTLLVASVGIVSGLVMLVHDKRKEIAVIRTMGARQRDIMAIFVAGGGIGLIGLALGVGSGCDRPECRWDPIVFGRRNRDRTLSCSALQRHQFAEKAMTTGIPAYS